MPCTQCNRSPDLALLTECVKTALQSARSICQQPQVSPYSAVYSQSTVCLLHVYYMSTVSLPILSVYCQSTVNLLLLSVYCQSTSAVSLLSVYLFCQSTVSLLLVYCLSTTCLLSVYSQSTICLLSVYPQSTSWALLQQQLCCYSSPLWHIYRLQHSVSGGVSELS